MQSPLDSCREQRWERGRATNVGPAELPEDLALPGDRRIEAGRDAEEVRDRGRIGPYVDGLDGSARLAEPGTRVGVWSDRREQLDAMTRHKSERSTVGGGRRESGEALARRYRRVPLMERPRDECFDDEIDRTCASASRKPRREICLTSPRITDDGSCVSSLAHQR